MAQIICNNLSLGYEGNTILKDLNFSVNKGDYLCIVGENGSGKSTLIRSILRLLPPVKGEIVIGDDLKINEIGYMPQKTAIQRDFPASVEEIVISGCLGRCGLRPYYNKHDKRLARESMERMEISSLSKHCYRELSGGQQQRVLLARALCAAQKILVLDEPASGLDPRTTFEMYELISRLNKENDITIIMISHDIVSALKYASHILHVDGFVFFGTKEEYLKSEKGRKTENFYSVNGGVGE